MLEEDLYTPTLNIIEFIESPLGLSFSKYYGDCELYPVQKFILKLMFGLPLDDENRSIKIPIWWQKYQSNKRWDYHFLTEHEYLHYLLDNDRASLPEDGGRPRVVSLVIGRQSGMSTILNFAALYDLYCQIEDPNPWIRDGLDRSELLEVGVLCGNLDLASRFSKRAKKEIDKCFFLNSNTNNSTRLSHYFDRPFNKKEERAESKLSFHHVRSSKLFNQSVYTHLYLDSCVSIKDDLFKDSFPLVTDSFIFSTSNPVLGTPFHEAYEEILDEPFSLTLNIPTWEVNPELSPEFFRRCRDSLTKENFDTELGAKFLNPNSK